MNNNGGSKPPTYVSVSDSTKTPTAFSDRFRLHEIFRREINFSTRHPELVEGSRRTPHFIYNLRLTARCFDYAYAPLNMTISG